MFAKMPTNILLGCMENFTSSQWNYESKHNSELLNGFSILKKCNYVERVMISLLI